MKSENSAASRREFLKNTGRIAAASALAGVAFPHVHAAENNTIQVALIGCGGRGTGAAANALATKSGPIKLVAMADVFDDGCTSSYAALKKECGDQVDVPDDRKFIGFDAYQKAMDCLRPGDVAIFATPPAFRWVHFGYAIKKGLNVFMEKPTTVDGPTHAQDAGAGRRVGEEEPQGGRGADVPPQPGPPGTATTGSRPARSARSSPCGPIACTGRSARFARSRSRKASANCSIRSGGSTVSSGPAAAAISDFNIHNIDECCWMKDAWPVAGPGAPAAATTAATPSTRTSTTTRSSTPSPTARSCSSTAGCIDGCYEEFGSYLHGTKGLAIISTAGTFAGQLPHLQGPEPRQGRSGLASPRTRAESLPGGMGRADRRHPPGQALQRGQTRCRGQPGHVDGPHGRPYRPGGHLRPDAQPSTTSSPPTSTS